MTEATAVNPQDALRSELAFVKRLMESAKNASDYLAAANAAADVAARAAKQLNQAIAAPTPEATVEVTIRNLPTAQGWNWYELKGLMLGLGLKPLRVDKNPRLDFGVASFASRADAAAAAKALAPQQLSENGQGVLVEDGVPPEYNRFLFQLAGQKRFAPEGDAGGGGAQQRRGPNAPAFRAAPASKIARLDVRDVVCPWWSKPYSEQLSGKAAKVAEALGRVFSEVDSRTYGAARPAWLTAVKQDTPQGEAPLACPLLGILASPHVAGYRNKNEFTMGPDVEEKPNVGYLLGAFADGVVAVANPDGCRHTPPTSCAYAHLVADFVRNHATLPVWDKRQGNGFYRLLVVREGRKTTMLQPVPGASADADRAAAAESRTFASLQPWKWLVTVGSAEQQAAAATLAPAEASSPLPLSSVGEPDQAVPAPDEILVMVQINDKFADAAAWSPEVCKLGAHIRREAAARGLPLSALRLQLHSGCSNAAPFDAPVQPFPAEAPGAATPPPDAAHIHDTLMDLRFRISPTAFFQVNSGAACLLYKVAGDWASTSSSTLLFDICCGTGTIGITLARHVSKVIGIDNVRESVDDARANAALNGITNCEYVCSKAEDALGGLLDKHAHQYQEVIAIVDPPRAGLHKDVCKAILRCAAVRRLVYISCNPDSLSTNMAQLCSPPGAMDSKRNAGRWGRQAGAQQQQQGDAAAADADSSYAPFVPNKAVAVDLFPHTGHVETVVLLKR